MRLSSIPLAHRAFRCFYLGETINTAGTAMAPIALAFAVLRVSNSPTALGWVIASWTIPLLTLMLLGGVISDRLPRSLVLRSTNTVQAVTQLTTAILSITGHAQIWHLCLLQFVAGSAAAIGYPAVQSMVPVLLPPDDRKAGYLLLSQTRSALSILGPALAGILVATLGPGWALLLDALTYLAAAGLLTLIHLSGRPAGPAEASLFTELREGLHFAHRLGWVLPGAVLSLVYNAAISGGVGVLGPAIANSTSIGSRGWGFARATEALGLFCFAFVLRRVTLRRPLIACHAGFLVGALPLLALATVSTTLPLLSAMFIAGCGAALNELAWNMTIQEKIPERMLSRILSVDGFFSYLALPIGQLAAGPLAQHLGERAVERGAALAMAITFLIAVATPSIRSLTLNAENPGTED